MRTPIRRLADHGAVHVDLVDWDGRLAVVKRLVRYNPTLERRLAREATILQKLDHPNLVPILAVEDGAVVYPYAPGIDLDDVLAQGPLRLRRATRIAGAMLDALAHAHDRGVLHHDVKPNNVRLRGNDVKLVDFGFAKDLGLSAITDAGMVLGTPQYMAPEQFRGERDDPRSDLYGVAAVTYHALTGGPPYGRNALRMLAGDASVTLEPVHGEGAPLFAWLARGLSREPSRRFADARSMKDALNAAQEGLAA